MSKFIELIFAIGFVAVGAIVLLYGALCIVLVTALWFPPINTHLQICVYFPSGSDCMGGPR